MALNFFLAKNVNITFIKTGSKLNKKKPQSFVIIDNVKKKTRITDEI